VIEENGFKGKQCPDCNLVYISPRPTLDEVIDLYGHSNATISAQSHITPSIFKTLHARHTLKIIKQYKATGDILEIGSGGGHFLAEARKQQFNPYGLELNPVQAEHIRSLGIPCEEKVFSLDSFGDKKFDLIYHCDVISHFFDPVKEFKTMQAKLKEGGIVIFETGNIGDIGHEHFKRFTVFQYPDHLFFFTEANCQQLLTQTGFTLKKVQRYNIIPALRILKMLYKPSSKKATSSAPRQSSGLKSVLKKLYHYGLYGVRYQLGRILPKHRRPQTMIVIAQKN
jgi:SAM-dependent methyltransferase